MKGCFVGARTELNNKTGQHMVQPHSAKEHQWPAQEAKAKHIHCAHIRRTETAARNTASNKTAIARIESKEGERTQSAACRPSVVCFIVVSQMLLVRQHIHQRLHRYYAQPAAAVVGGTAATTADAGKMAATHIPFRRLWGEWDWKRRYRALYEQTSGQWLTPVELFAPHYSHAVARWIAATVRSTAASNAVPPPSTRIEIVEIGGGRGTNARLVLEYLRAHHNEDVYRHLSQYRLVDASSTLLELQRDTVDPGRRHYSSTTAATVGIDDEEEEKKEKEDAAARVTFERLDMLDVAEGRSVLFERRKREEVEDAESFSPASTSGSRDEEDGDGDTNDNHHHHLVVVLALEVLDNLPHDKIRVSKRTGELEQCELEVETAATEAEAGAALYREVYRPVSDPLLHRVLDTYPCWHEHHRSSSSAMWIPTVTCGVLLQLLQLHQQQPLSLSSPSSPTPSSSSAPSQSTTATSADTNAATTAAATNTTTTTAVLLADFDYLPVSVGKPKNEPIVTDMDRHDLPHYLSPTDSPTDILFPTDFAALAHFIDASTTTMSTVSKDGADPPSSKRNDDTTNTNSAPSSHTRVQKQAAFLEEYGDVAATRSWLTGYSPLTGDFSNCSVLTMVTTTSSSSSAGNL
jgi:Putative S-adenosyl-L-methionine-dependent methyltransferase